MIKTLKRNDGTEIVNSAEILEETANYYEHLYKRNDLVTDNHYNFFFQNHIPKLSDEQNKTISEPILKTEIYNALKSMDDNKTPGSDGLTKQFYEHFWNFIIEPLFNSYSYSLGQGYLSLEQRRGIIRLIPKKDKDLMLLKNWRPISLQNIDTKLLSLSIAKRFQKVLPDIIESDQNGFLKDRFIGYNICLLYTSPSPRDS